jgi:ABC-type Fe3+/spermidine/putrescine transport system ATPase subunit
MKVVEFENITKAFGNVVAVAGISFDVKKGEIVSLLGPSGCGKTTTLRLIAGFETPDGGVIHLAGKNVHGEPPYARNVGLLFQDYALFPHMTVAENIAYGLRRRGIDRRSISSRLMQMLQLVKLVGCEERRPSQLSGGQQQRVALARALAIEPQVMLLDEPLSALDAKLRQELRIELREILTAVGLTAIVVTHDQEEAMSIADRIIVLNGGRIVQEGTAREIYAHPATKFVAEFIGRSNWFLGRLQASISSGLSEFLTNDGHRLRVRFNGVDGHGVNSICVRPERMRIEEDDSRITEHANRFSAKVVNVAYLGADVHITVEAGKGQRVLVVEKNFGHPVPDIGQIVFVAFDPDDCMALT